MNDSTTSRRSMLGLVPGRPVPELYEGLVEVLRTRHNSRCRIHILSLGGLWQRLYALQGERPQTW